MLAKVLEFEETNNGANQLRSIKKRHVKEHRTEMSKRDEQTLHCSFTCAPMRLYEGHEG